jgi:hypothetical protein
VLLYLNSVFVGRYRLIGERDKYVCAIAEYLNNFLLRFKQDQQPWLACHVPEPVPGLLPIWIAVSRSSSLMDVAADAMQTRSRNVKTDKANAKRSSVNRARVGTADIERRV